ncbi:type IV pilin [Halorarius halobius]|uniref:type IV pilin n=1 Tax=Halorarius halobius TaxID=2962671 RepID=UPI0020CB9B0F|nr:type IV pilin [Halorarius halobius]
MFRSRSSSDERALSPVVGAALLVAIVVVLGVIGGTMALGLTETTDPAPTAQLSLSGTPGACQYSLRHGGGDTLEGDRIEVRGVADPGVLGGRELTTGESARVNPEREKLRVVWRKPGSDTSYVVARFRVENPDAKEASWACAAGTLYTGEGGRVKVVAPDGAVVELSATTDLAALGPADTDLTGDGRADVPYVSAGGSLRLTNDTNGTTTVASGGDIPGTIETSKTRLGVGRWNGSAASVFFVNENHDTLYRVRPGDSPVEVATPGNGVQAVSGVGDVDGDGTDELVFADASQQLRYLEPDGTTNNLDGGQTGSNTGIGAGALADFDDDGVASVVAVDGSNDVKVTGAPTADGGEGTTVVTAADAAKAPVTAADVDDDDDPEIVYVGLDAGKVKYVDDVRGANSVAVLRDEDGNAVGASDELGVV